MQMSVIIPTYQEGKNIGCLIKQLVLHGHQNLLEILVVDGGSYDNTTAAAKQAGAQVHTAPSKGRAAQMNLGATLAKGDVLYFVHADTLPPATYTQDICQAIQQGYKLGCFRSKFDSEKLLLKINGYCSRFEGLMCRGGDQTLFITRALFDALQGYDEYYTVMEEYDLIRRACTCERFKIIESEVQVSARKYDHNSYLRVNFANFVVFNMFRMGYAPDKIKSTYQKLLDYNI